MAYLIKSISEKPFKAKDTDEYGNISYIYIEPDEELTIKSESLLKTLLEAKLAKTAVKKEEKPKDENIDNQPEENLEDLTKDQLEEKAVSLGVDLKAIEGTGSNGAVVKADIVKAIESIYQENTESAADLV